MRWLNSLYIRELDVDTFHAKALPFYEKVDYLKGYDLRFLSELLHSRCEVLADVGRLTEFLTEFDSFDLELFVNKKWKTDCALARELIPSLKEVVKKGEENLAVNLENLAADK